MSLLEDLNSQQKLAVTTTEGPVLVLAGAGSGKTRALTYRIAYLMQKKQVSPYNILAVTFTNKAANEMAERVATLLNQKSKIKNAVIASDYKERGNLSELKIAEPVPRYRGILTPRNDTDKIDQTSNETMKQRSNTKLPWLGTFHSICVKILRREAHHIGYERSFTIYDDQDQQAVIKKILKDLQLDPKKNPPSTISYFISGAKAELIGPDEYAGLAAGNFQKLVSQIYFAYEQYLKRAQAMDFDDLLFNCVRLFQKNPEILAKYQNQFKYILIDEYQDTNRAQYIWAKLLASSHKNICVVGDDFQSIYSWRGANFRNILDFEKDYPEATVIKMEQNYRSTKSILGAAQGVIEKNLSRTDKKIWTQNNEGVPLTVYEALNDRDEADFVVREIRALRTASKSEYSNFAILYRTNAQSRIFEENLIRFEIPYQIIGGVSFYQRREIKDLLAYLRFINNPKDLISLERIINVPIRGIGEKTAAKLLAMPGIMNPSFAEATEGRHESRIMDKDLEQFPEKVKSFFALIEEFRGVMKKEPIVKLIESVAIRTGIKDMFLDGTPEGEARWGNIEELMNLAAPFGSESQKSKIKDQNYNSKVKNSVISTESSSGEIHSTSSGQVYSTDLSTPLRSARGDKEKSGNDTEGLEVDEEEVSALDQFLERVSLYQDNEKLGGGQDAVTLMTLHAAKGLEFETVFIVGLEEGIFPHSRSIMETDQLEEERRLCYVGMTRARKRLYLLYALERLFHGNLQSCLPSRFIGEVPSEFLDVI